MGDQRRAAPSLHDSATGGGDGLQLNPRAQEDEAGTNMQASSRIAPSSAVIPQPSLLSPRRISSSSDVCRDDTIAQSMDVKQRIFQVLEVPSSSRLAMVISLLIFMMIFLSTVTFCLESMPELRDTDPAFWLIFETIAISIFTAEYLARLATCPDRWQFVRAPLNIIDVAAILPFYLNLVFAGDGNGGSDGSGGNSDFTGLAVLRVIRLARVFRIFKLAKYSAGFTRVFIALQRSLDALYLLVFLLVISMVVFSSCVFFAESAAATFDESRGAYVYLKSGQISPFQSIPGSFWWCMVTMTTVGYGDAVPVTVGGRLIAVCAMLVGLLAIAFPITVIGTNFQDIWKEEKNAPPAQDASAAKPKPTASTRSLAISPQLRMSKRWLPLADDSSYAICAGETSKATADPTPDLLHVSELILRLQSALNNLPAADRDPAARLLAKVHVLKTSSDSLLRVPAVARDTADHQVPQS